jgi:dTDP-4-dehydrorhamnose reductase
VIENAEVEHSILLAGSSSATSPAGWSPRCSAATSRSAATSASRARTGSWSATTRRSGSFADSQGVPRAYVESDPTGPRTVYGQTKLAGEREVLGASPRHAVVRSAWLFGIAGRNFADTMLKLAGDREAVQVVTDQVGCPTWTGHLAPALLGLLERGVAGLVHLAGTGHVSWNDFATEIFRQAGVSCRVEGATSEQLARPAPRPAWSVLESEREDVLPLPPWQDGLAGYLAARAGIVRT